MRGAKESYVCMAGIADFLAISRLDRVVWTDNRNSEYIPDGEHIWRLWVEYARVYVSRYGDVLTGAAVMFPSNDRRLFLLHKMFVKREYRGIGVGTKLFSLLTEDLDQLRADCMLTTDPANTAMQRLCAKHGFFEKHLVPSYYRKDEDRYVIFRRIAPD